ncbi:MAG: GH92 family glycosyl hydrolase [Melioribacteraceae bacterium]|nr:GH92 family glycosyl hydrolase [Melioribacteraceae bacterium]MCF8265744.1 GH92 family glycosyl hydrolase [Melioribacteraceae bacterium]MCF8432315.1 GH92 family glycosyl hydrolase [Melioribacteraceae bacterium]
MNKLIFPLFLLLFISCSTGFEESADPIHFVDPFIGTGGHGHTYPGATAPFGMVQLSPDNPTSGWDWCSGYHYSDSVIVGFSHKHLSGTGIGDLYDIQFMPGIGAYEIDSSGNVLYQSGFKHKNESASPGFYSVLLDDSNIKVELTATKRAGFQRFTFPQNDSSFIALNLGFRKNWDTPIETNIKIYDDSTLVGYRFSKGWAQNQKVFFAAKFSKPFFKSKIGKGNNLTGNIGEVSGKDVKGLFYYPTTENEKVLLKVGISSSSIPGALLNLETEIPDWDFESVRLKTQNNWNEELSKIKVSSEDQDSKTIFYSAFYHSMLAPTLFSDVDGNYRGTDDEIHKTAANDYYTTLSLWDTFRAAHPLYTITHPKLVGDFVNSTMEFDQQSGLLPVWALEANETNTMIGYHAIPVIVDAYFKGLTNIHPKEILEAFERSAMQDEGGIKELKEFGYIPADLINESVSKTLEYAFDDYCIAQLAGAIGENEKAEYYSTRSKSFVNLFDKSTNFMRGKNSDGTWKTPFNPKFASHRDDEYTEGNAWQYTWFVPHDVENLIKLMGGKEKFVGKLDSLFTIDSKVEGENVSPDISGLIGQYAHGNEPSHHIAYLYTIAGYPEKTAKLVRQILETQYSSQPDGLSGNEDCGQMSAWYIFSSLGFYPVNPADGKYYFGSPLFNSVELDLINNKKFRIVANNNGIENVFIERVELNGETIDRNYILHSEIMKGGVLEFYMTKNSK